MIPTRNDIDGGQLGNAAHRLQGVDDGLLFGRRAFDRAVDGEVEAAQPRLRAAAERVIVIRT